MQLKREFQRVTKKDVDAFQRHLNCVLKEYAKEQIRQECYMCSNKYCTQAWEIIRGDNCTAGEQIDFVLLNISMVKSTLNSNLASWFI